MSTKGQELVCDGAICECNQGYFPTPLKVTSQTKDHVQEKLIATSEDKTANVNIKPFGQCKLKTSSAGHLPCMPVPTAWQDVFEAVCIVDKANHPLLEKSTLPCAVGGTIKITDTGQIEVPASPTKNNKEQIASVFSCLAPVVNNEKEEKGTQN